MQFVTCGVQSYGFTCESSGGAAEQHCYHDEALYLSKLGYLMKMTRKCGGLLVTCREVGLLAICTQFGSKIL